MERDVVEPRRAGFDDDLASRGRELAARIDEQGYHLVVIWGGQGAGKSTLLASLLAYLQGEAVQGMQVALGAPLMVDQADYAKAARFFHEDAPRFGRGDAPESTDATGPLLVPVVLKPAGDLPEVKFAFLECSGTATHADTWADSARVAHGDDIAHILLNVQGGISFLHVAPCTQTPTWTEAAAVDKAHDRVHLDAADRVLAARLDTYHAVRVPKHRDAHLLLLSKWDAHAPPAPHGSFALPVPGEVTTVARDRAPRAFAAFLRLATSAPRQPPRQVMQYCAGIISGRSVVRPGVDLQDPIERYPRVLWSWLYAQATGNAGPPRVLFPTRVPRPRLYDAMDRGIARVLKVLGV